MPAEISLELLPSELTQIVESVYQTMLNLEADEGGIPWFPGADRLTAAVHLAGAWNGAVLLECDRREACLFAARYLSMDAREVVDDVVRDVLGELANVIGGNLKSALGSGIGLSMPSVVDGSNYSLRVCGADVHTRVAFRCADGFFWVTVLTMRSEPSAARRI